MSEVEPVAVTRFEELFNLLNNTLIPAKKISYHCIYIDEYCTIFGPTRGSNKVMIPTDLILEWISAYELGVINTNMDSLKCRKIMNTRSDWANQLHSFNTHIFAIVRHWEKQKQ